MTTTVHTAMKDNSRRALRGLAVTLSLIVYVAGLIYAGVRSYDLFAKTIPANLLMLALLGIVALELTALALPVAIHYWTAPGPQRMAALGFYMLDLFLIAANAVLDAAHNAGTLLPDFMAAYGTFGVPALPIVCMVGWAIVWALDPTSREHDMTAAVKAATFDAMLSQIVEESKSVDIADDVRSAAAERARAIVGETLGKSKAALQIAAPTSSASHPTADDDRAAIIADLLAALQARDESVNAKPHINGTRRKVETEHPKG